MPLLILIASISVYDAYWTFKTQDVIADVELNPMGLYLIKLDDGDVALFMTMKMIGTMIVISVIPLLYYFRKWWGMTVAISISTFQVALFFYLIFG